MSYLFSFIVVLFLALRFPFIHAQKIHLGLLVINESYLDEREVRSVHDFLSNDENIFLQTLSLQKNTGLKDLNELDIIWFHHTDSTFTSPDQYQLDILNQYIEEGGKLLLSLEGFRLIHNLGLEPNNPQVRYKTAIDRGYGRKLGLHAFLHHPVFEGLNGGSYIFKPLHDTTLRVYGYFEDHDPLNGAVVAVDWDYIFIRENSKLLLEYWQGNGKVLAIGGYTNFSEPNDHRKHLEMFLHNCIQYLVTSKDDTSGYYWQYYQPAVIPSYTEYQTSIERAGSEWQLKPKKWTIQRDAGTNNFWDVTGEQIAVMGREKGGIDEIWAHPFMAFRDYHAGIKIDTEDSVRWLNNLIPSIEARPESFVRYYELDDLKLTEIVTVSQNDPVGVIHYLFSGSRPIQMFIAFTCNMRLMWPYSENVTKNMEYTHDAYLNAFVVTTEKKLQTAIIGSNKEPLHAKAGQFEGFSIDCSESGNGENYCKFREIATEDFKVSGIFYFRVNPGEEFDMVVSAGYTADNTSSRAKAIDNYVKTINKTDSIYGKSCKHTEQLLNEYLIITTPDDLFNEGFRWSLMAADRFIVNTPGLGKSLVAGYSTTGTGWDGGHGIDGRPGYAWYFGRDGQWSGFALLDYGDFETVRAMLEMYIKFQDLYGKIYHEISTSGVVHYDAADATPLFIILAGRYLQHTGDIDFIRSNWSAVKKSIDFCFSTDTDKDHLIENTNVGHGWVEGGHLFGSHSSLYLSSCWAEALQKAEYMANALGLENLADFYSQESDTVINILNTDFWNPERKFLYHGKFRDNTYHPEQTILASIPVFLGQIEPLKAAAMIKVYAENNFSSDWGCRIVSSKSPDFTPRGYHTGSVWPLFTGWASLAEYSQGLDVQGFIHMMNNLLVYRHWGLGFVEEVLNGEIYEPAGVCHHQCWSQTMVIQPAIEGMLGFKPHALKNLIELSPKFPAHWDAVEAKNLKIGNHSIDFTMERDADTTKYHFRHRGDSDVELVFDPKFSPGTEINQLIIHKNSSELFADKQKPIRIDLKDELIIEYHTKNGIKVLPKICYPEPGDASSGVRFVSEQLVGNVYTILLEAPQDSRQIIQVYIKDKEISNVKNGQLINRENNVYDFEVIFHRSNDPYVQTELMIETM